MDWIETSGSSVSEALEKALAALGVDISDLEFIILEEARKGVFGRVKSEARIRARVRPETNKNKRIPNRNNGERRREVRSPKGARKNDRRPVKSRNDQPRKPKADNLESQENNAPKADPKAVATLVEDFLAGLIDALQIDAEFGVVINDDNTVKADITGEGLGFLVGHKGATLNALQDVTRNVVRQKLGPSHRVDVDVEHYKQKRADALRAFVRSLAEEVIATGATKALEPMSAADRKIVHDALLDLPGVKTSSRGVSPNRFVVIQPDK